MTVDGDEQMAPTPAPHFTRAIERGQADYTKAIASTGMRNSMGIRIMICGFAPALLDIRQRNGLEHSFVVLGVE